MKIQSKNYCFIYGIGHKRSFSKNIFDFCHLPFTSVTNFLSSIIMVVPFTRSLIIFVPLSFILLILFLIKTVFYSAVIVFLFFRILFKSWSQQQQTIPTTIKDNRRPNPRMKLTGNIKFVESPLALATPRSALLCKSASLTSIILSVLLQF